MTLIFTSCVCVCVCVAVSWPFFEKNYSSIPEDIVKIGGLLIEKLPWLYEYHHKQEVSLHTLTQTLLVGRSVFEIICPYTTFEISLLSGSLSLSPATTSASAISCDLQREIGTSKRGTKVPLN